MTTEPPNINPEGRYTFKQACEALKISRTSLWRATRLGARHGGIDAKISRRNGKKIYLGKELLRYWMS